MSEQMRETMSDSTDEVTVDKQDLLELELSSERLQRLRMESHLATQALEEARVKAETVQKSFNEKYSENGKYQLVSVDKDTLVLSRRLAPTGEGTEDEN